MNSVKTMRMKCDDVKSKTKKCRYDGCNHRAVYGYDIEFPEDFLYDYEQDVLNDIVENYQIPTRCLFHQKKFMIKLIKENNDLNEEHSYSKIWNNACIQNDIETLKFLNANGIKGCSTMTMDLAARYGNLEIVIWLYKNRLEGCTKTAMTWAIENGHLDVVKWLYKNNFKGFSRTVLMRAIQNGHLDVVKWLKGKC
jgi:hypothetical protein